MRRYSYDRRATSSEYLDMVAPDDVKTSTSHRQKRGAPVSDTSRKWPLAKVPFEFNANLREYSVLVGEVAE